MGSLMTKIFSWTEDYQIYVTANFFEAGSPVPRPDAGHEAVAIHSQLLFTFTELGQRQVTTGNSQSTFPHVQNIE
jgi:hypothetical protein